MYKDRRTIEIQCHLKKKIYVHIHVFVCGSSQNQEVSIMYYALIIILKHL